MIENPQNIIINIHFYLYIGVAGKASFVVFSTDYTNYAGIFSCQKIPFGNRHSVTILSRSKTLDKQYVDKVS